MNKKIKACWDIVWPFLLALFINLLTSIIITMILTVKIMVSQIQGGQMPDSIGMQEQITDLILKYGIHITTIINIVELPLFYILYKKVQNSHSFRDLKFQKWSMKKALSMAVIAITGACLGNLFLSLIVTALPQIAESYSTVAQSEDETGIVTMLIASGIVAPLIEEVIFRGLIFGQARRYVKCWQAMVISAVFFGIYHLNMVQFLYATFMGLILAWLYEMTGSLTGPVFAHMIANVFIVLRSRSDFMNWMYSNLPVLIFTTSVLAFLFIISIHDMKTSFEQSREHSIDYRI